jgi:hypothetical protein
MPPAILPCRATSKPPDERFETAQSGVNVPRQVAQA